jgi:hypothetical protein
MSKFSNGGPFETLRKEIGPMLKARGGRGGSVGGGGVFAQRLKRTTICGT